MRLLVVAQEFPYPPTHGGRVDVWRRLLALKHCGAQLALVCWYEDTEGLCPSSDEIDTVRALVEVLHVIPKRFGFLPNLIRSARIIQGTPSHAASRILDKGALAKTLTAIHDFSPEAVMLDSLYGGMLAMAVKNMFRVPLFYRAHNIEHRYMDTQARAAERLIDTVAWRLACVHLERFETRIIRESTAWFDISVESLEFWKRRGFTHGYWLPPMIDREFASRLGNVSADAPGYDVGYLGNLFAPNNVYGVLWFLEQVVPLLRRRMSEINVFIAGSRPVESVVNAARRSGVRLIVNPTDSVPVLRDAHVLVNPVFSGSGVNIKSVEMLFCPAQLVSTTQGIAGLPESIKSHFHQADTPDSFADAILGALSMPEYDPAERENARKEFSFLKAEALLQQMKASL